jgi:regulator of protease activity HflC (stomatin/prohibitin superfamily)
MTELRETLSGHRQVTGALVPGLLLLAVLLLGAGAAGLGSSVAAAAALHPLLLLFLLLGTRRSLGLRLRRGASEEPPPRVISIGLLRLAGGLLVIGAAAAQLAWVRFDPGASVAGFGALAGLLLALAFAAVVLARYYQATSARELPDAYGLASGFRVAAWLALLAASSLMLRAVGRPLWEQGTAWALLALPALFAVELTLHGFAGLIRRPRAGEAFGADLLLTRTLGSSFNLVQSLFTAVERTFGVDVRSSWALRFLRRAALPALLALGSLAWLLSSVVVLDAAQVGVRERFGRVMPGALEPGLHLGLPWPLDRVRRVDAQSARSLPIGYTEAKSGAQALWTQYHAAEEFNLLLGDGRDLVTINAELVYRVGDAHDWLYGCQNPERALETLAYRVLMGDTVDQTLDQVLSLEIGDFSARMTEAIQREADEHQLGVEVLAFDLRGLHPPVAVANDYQAVVAAQIDRGTYIMEAQAYRYGALPKAEADAVRATRRAQADEAGRLSKAKGEAIAFETIGAQYGANPELYRYRRRLETLEQVLQDNPHYVIDARIERDGGALWVLE